MKEAMLSLAGKLFGETEECVHRAPNEKTKKKTSCCQSVHSVIPGSSSCNDTQACAARVIIQLMNQLERQKVIRRDIVHFEGNQKKLDAKHKGLLLWMRLLSIHLNKSRFWEDFKEHSESYVLNNDGLKKQDSSFAPSSLKDIAIKILESCVNDCSILKKIADSMCPCLRVVLSGEPRVFFRCCNLDMHALCYCKYIDNTCNMSSTFCPCCKSPLQRNTAPVLIPPSSDYQEKDQVMSPKRQNSNVILEFVLSRDGGQRKSGIDYAKSIFCQMNFSMALGPRGVLMEIASLIAAQTKFCLNDASKLIKA